MSKLFLCYCRVSTDEQVMGYSLDAQQTMIKDWVNVKYPNVEITFYVEKGRSATDLNRPQLKELLDRARKEKAYAVVVLCLDRLTRNVEDLCWLMNFFQDTGIKLLSVMNYVDLDSADGRGNLLYNGVSAMMESQKISERTIRGMKQAVFESKYPFARCPLGYEKVEDKLVISSNKNEVMAAQYVFNTIADNKINLNKISKEVKEKYDVNLKANMIIVMLSRQLYTGKIKYRGVENKNYCEALIDDETFKNAVQNYRKKRRSQHKAEYYFKGIVYCGDCNNEPMNHICGYGGHNKEVYSYYVCPKCKRIASQLKLVEVLTPKLHTLVSRYYMDESKSDNDNIREKIKDYKKQQDRLIKKQKGDKAIDVDVFYDLFRDLEKKIDELNEQLYKSITKSKPYSHLSYLTKKSIASKYIKMIVVRFNKNSFDAELIEKKIVISIDTYCRLVYNNFSKIP